MSHIALGAFDSYLHVMLWDKKAKQHMYDQIGFGNHIAPDGRLADADSFALSLKSLGLKKGTRVFMSLKTSECILRFASFPPLTSKELAGALRYNAANLFPLSLENYIVDYTCSLSVTGNTRVLLAAIPKDLVEGYIDIFTDLGLRIERVTIFQDAVAASLHKTGKPDSLLITEMGGKINIAILENGMVWEAADIRSADEDYVSATRPFLRTTRGETIRGVYIACNGDARFSTLIDYLEEQSIPVYICEDRDLWEMSLEGVFYG